MRTNIPILIAFCACILPGWLDAEQAIITGTIRGLVKDRSTRQPIINANLVVTGTQLGASTDLQGSYLIVGLPPGTYSIQASALGYLPAVESEVSISPGRSVDLTFYLEPSVIIGEEVVVHAGYFKPSADMPVSSRSLRYEEVRRAPGGAEDVQRVIQALPGVVSSNDQTNEIIVRGGSPAEHLTVIDGFEIDNINHFPEQANSGGPISLIDPEFLQKINFSTGGFSARFGDRLSSILEIELREGNRDRFGGEIFSSMAGAGANLEGGFAGRKGSYLLSYRKSYLDLIHKSIGLTSVPHYWDSQFKAGYDISVQSKLSVLGLYADDRITIESEDGDAWSRGAESLEASGYLAAISARLRRVWKKGYTVSVLGRSEAYLDHTAIEVDKDPSTGILSTRETYFNRTTETTTQLHSVWTAPTRSTEEISIGLGIKPISFSHDRWIETDTTVYDIDSDGFADTTTIRPSWRIFESTSTMKYFGFFQYRYRPTNELTIICGGRLDGLDYSSQLTLAPRASIRWIFRPNWTLGAAYGIYYQAHPLVVYTFDPGGGNRNLPHSRAVHYISSLEYLPRESTLLSFELYYKQYNNLPVRENELLRDVDPTFYSWKHLGIGRKSAWGFELFAQQKLAGNWYGTASYSYGRSYTDNSLKTHPSSFDFRHIATIVAGYNFSGLPVRAFQRKWYGWITHLLPISGDELTLSSRFRYVSGRPFTTLEWTTRGYEMGLHWEESTAINKSRYPAYSRWDVRWDSKWYYHHKAVVVFLEIENILDRPNIAQYIYADDGERLTAHQFRFFFVGGVRFEW